MLAPYHALARKLLETLKRLPASARHRTSGSVSCVSVHAHKLKFMRSAATGKGAGIGLGEQSTLSISQRRVC